MLPQMNSKIDFICGDFNIDLLNPNKHNIIDEFVNTMYNEPNSENHQTQ